MLNEKSVTVAIHDELVSIRQRLMEKDYSQLDKVPTVLRLIQDMLAESHPSGYPDPSILGCIASFLRDEKFRDRRENQCTTPLSTDIQTLIDRLKKLRTQAEAARPQKMRQLNWAERDWGGGGKGTDFLLVCILLLSLILTVALLFIDVSNNTMLLFTVAYYGFFIVIGIFVKDITLIFTLINFLFLNLAALHVCTNYLLVHSV